MKKKKALKVIKIVLGTCAFAGIGYFIWRNGYSLGCRETAEEEVVFIRENYPEAYRIIVGLQ